MGVIMEPGQRVQQYDRNLDLDLGEDIRYLDLRWVCAYTMADPAWNTEGVKGELCSDEGIVRCERESWRRLDTISLIGVHITKQKLIED